LVPEKFLRDYCQIKNQITNHVIENYPKPSNYKHLAAVNAMISDIESQPLNVDMSPILPKVSDIKVSNFVKRIKTCDRSIRYNLFGTVTGRLATRKNSFPILTMNKEYREVLKPNNDCFIELDYNGAELRVLLSLLGYDQPEHDVHQWNLDNVFENKVTRAEAKTLFFAWLYGSQSDDVRRHSSLLREKYNKDTLIDKYWDGHVIRTPFDRDVISPKHKALNYLVQSVAADLALEQATKVWALLKKNKAKSSVAFIVHDALVIDFDLADRELFKEVQEIFSLTRFGKFPVNKSIGKDFGSLKEVT
jgi:DNA polymerase I-like protein with 3'-5' exonuclease and polymerase domains